MHRDKKSMENTFFIGADWISWFVFDGLCYRNAFWARNLPLFLILTDEKRLIFEEQGILDMIFGYQLSRPKYVNRLPKILSRIHVSFKFAHKVSLKTWLKREMFGHITLNILIRFWWIMLQKRFLGKKLAPFLDFDWWEKARIWWERRILHSVQIKNAFVCIFYFDAFFISKSTFLDFLTYFDCFLTVKWPDQGLETRMGNFWTLKHLIPAKKPRF